MKLRLAYKYRIYPTEEQEVRLQQIFTLARRCWNIYLATLDGELKNIKEKIPLGRTNYKLLRQEAENAWMNEVISNHRYEDYVVKALRQAITKFWDAAKKGDVGRAQARYKAYCELTGKKFRPKRYNGFYKPKFKRYDDLQSFTTDAKGGAVLNLEESTIQIHKKLSPIKIKIPKDDKIWSENITKIAAFNFKRDKVGRHFLSINLEVEREIEAVEIEDTKQAVGIDLGCKTFAVLSKGEKREYDVRDCDRLKVKIKKLQEQLSRQKLKSKNWYKTKQKIAKLHARIANIRKEDTHQFTNYVSKHFDLICVEDLSPKNMTKKAKPKLGEDGKTFVRNNKKQKAGLNRSILSKNFFETNRQLKYKAEWRGKEYVKIGRFYPSSKTCGTCGEVNNELKLAHREWVCTSCGTIHDRDKNASENIEREGVKKFFEKQK